MSHNEIWLVRLKLEKMSETKVSVEEATKMSLDEYINATRSSDLSKKYNRKYKKHDSSINGEEYEEMAVDEPLDENPSSQQWRLKYPNRPVGMAPLIPSNLQSKRRFKNFNHNQRRPNFRGPYADGDAPPRVNRNNQPSFKPDMRRLNNNFSMISKNTSSDLVPINQNTIAALNNFSQSLAAVGSQMFPNASSYMDIAQMFLAKFNEVQQHRNIQPPKYNMEVQKEICQIQNKTLYFTCGSDGPPSVVSFDGSGVDDCEIKVSTTDKSLNQRFA